MNVEASGGLTQDEILLSRKNFGMNKIDTGQTTSYLQMILVQFSSPLVIILIAAGLLSGFFGDWVDCIAISTILILNAMIGFFQEFKADKAVMALKDTTAPRATVVRDSRHSVIPASEVVQGDLILLEAGDIVAADAEILQCAALKVNEAILTGESLPVEKSEAKEVSDANSKLVFMGSAVVMGSARCQVTQVGMKTKLGEIANLLAKTVSPPTPLQIQLNKVGKALLILIVGVVALVLILGYLRQTPWVELIIFSISLAVAIVPEGMPAIVTVALALGVRRMAARHALVRNLPAVETLGSVSVICTDKTGTLTTGDMRVREMSSKDDRELLIAAASCCEAELGQDDKSGVGDPTEIAILLKAKECGFSKAENEKINPRMTVHPFDSVRKRMSILRKDEVLYVKGAFESVIPLCVGLGSRRSEINLSNEAFAKRGLRVLAIAKGKSNEERDLTYLGLVAIADPPRMEVKKAIEEARAAGIVVVMITGDHLATASAIALELGIVKAGEEVEKFVHSRASPEQKLKIIRDFRSKGDVVAMIGDGVNDAPSLREAHIGIAMGKAGTEVTRQAAGLILADDNFATIISAIREGRGIYQNIRKAIVFLLTGNVGELFAVVGASALGLPLPFLAPHLLWINLVTDSLPALALINEPVSEAVMNKAPRSSSEKILGMKQWKRIALIAAIEGSIVIAIFSWTFQNEGLVEARNLAFAILVLSQLFRSLGARSDSKTIFELGLRSNLWLIGIFVFTVGLQLSLHYIPLTQEIFGLIPLSGKEFKIILPASLLTTALIEISKLIVRMKSKVILKKAMAPSAS